MSITQSRRRRRRICWLVKFGACTSQYLYCYLLDLYRRGNRFVRFKLRCCHPQTVRTGRTPYHSRPIFKTQAQRLKLVSLSLYGTSTAHHCWEGRLCFSYFKTRAAVEGQYGHRGRNGWPGMNAGTQRLRLGEPGTCR